MSNKENDSSKLDESNDGLENKSKKYTYMEKQNEIDDNIQITLKKDNGKEDPYLKYITHIEQLQNELELEKSITNSLKNFGAEGEKLIKLKSELQEYEQKLKQLKQTNIKQ